MEFTRELLEKAKTAKTAEELLELAKAENIEMTAEEAAKAFAELNKTGELADEELNNVAAGCGEEPSGDTPKYKIGDRLAMVHPNCGRHVAVEITYVSSEKSRMKGVDVFTYNALGRNSGETYTDRPEYDFCILDWAK